MVELTVKKGDSSPVVVQVRAAEEMDAVLAQILDSYPANPTETWEISMRDHGCSCQADATTQSVTIRPDFVRRIDSELAGL